MSRPLFKVRVPRSDISSATPVGWRDLGFNMRVFGSGGFFGVYGLFYNKKIGYYWAYATRTDCTVLIHRKHGWPLMLSPDEPEALLECLGVPGLPAFELSQDNASRKKTSLWTWIIGVALIIAVPAFVGYLLWGTGVGREMTFEITPAGIKLGGNFYERTVPFESMLAKRAKIADFNTEPGLRPALRTNGIAMSGYQSGWYQLRNGEKALLFVTGNRKSIYIPTVGGYALLISPPEPERFMQELMKH
jgi:hypothetical protein